jgi:hypothetical protein
MVSFPVYPFAFIQVPAVARRANIEVICRDLLGVPQEQWPQVIEDLYERHQPAMVLITLRNTDSMNYSDYRRGRGGEGTGYFPIEQTKALIDAIRTLIDVPVAVGGFGFSLLAKELMPILRPDFGVYGGADAFFLHFEDILLGNYQHVSNLLYFQEDAVIANKRIYFPPPSRPEYTSQAIEEMIAFYKKFPEPGFQGAPVEIMRGCSHTCVFCAEPFVAGRQVQYRDLSAIMGDIELLVNNGVTEICMIMSELNPEGNGFILRLADKIRAFNEQKPAARKLSWFGANYLLTFDRDDYRRLYASTTCLHLIATITGAYMPPDSRVAGSTSRRLTMKMRGRCALLTGMIRLSAVCKTMPMCSEVVLISCLLKQMLRQAAWKKSEKLAGPCFSAILRRR